MDKTSFGNTGYSLSKIGMGTVQFGVDYGYTKKKTQPEVDQILKIAHEKKINYLDTASEYGDSEKKIGAYLAKHPKEFTIFTKLKRIHEMAGQTQECLKDAMWTSVYQSMSNLGVPYIDFLLLHQTEKQIIANPAVFRNLDDMKMKGLVKGIGVSVYTPDEVDYVMKEYGATVDFFQIPVNIFDRRFNRIIDMLYEKKIGMIGRSTFLKGIIPCSNDLIPEGLKEIIPYKNRLRQAAATMGLSDKELALLYVTCDKRISSTILGIDTIEELEEDIEIIINKSGLYRLMDDSDGLEIKDTFLIDPRRWDNF